MLIDVTQTITGYAGEEIPDQTGKPLTFREAAFQALNSMLPDDNPPIELKEKLYALTSKLYSGPAVELTIDDAALLKQRSGSIMSPLVHGRIADILERANDNTPS